MLIRAVQGLIPTKKWILYAVHAFIILAMIGMLVFLLAPQQAVGQPTKQGAKQITPWAARLANPQGPTADAKPNIDLGEDLSFKKRADL